MFLTKLAQIQMQPSVPGLIAAVHFFSFDKGFICLCVSEPFQRWGKLCKWLLKRLIGLAKIARVDFGYVSLLSYGSSWCFIWWMGWGYNSICPCHASTFFCCCLWLKLNFVSIPLVLQSVYPFPLYFSGTGGGINSLQSAREDVCLCSPLISALQRKRAPLTVGDLWYLTMPTNV